MNTFFSRTYVQQVVLTICMAVLAFACMPMPAQAATEAEQFAQMEAQLDKASKLVAQFVSLRTQGRVLGVNSLGSSPSESVATQTTPRLTPIQALQAQLKALILQRDNFNKKVADLNAQIEALKTKIEQMGTPVVSHTTFNITVPTAVQVGSTYTLEWKDGTTGTIANMLKSYPNATTQIFMYPSGLSGSGFHQTFADKMSAEQILAKKIKWTVREKSDDGRVMPSGKYVIAMAINAPYNNGGSISVGQGDSNEFSLTAAKLPTCDAITANPITLPVGGGSVTLAWNTTNATVATLSSNLYLGVGDESGTVPVDGSKVVKVLQTKTFSLNAKNTAGVEAKCSVTVTVGGEEPASVSRVSYDAKPIADLSAEFAQATFALTVKVTANKYGNVYIPKSVASKKTSPYPGFHIGFTDRKGTDVSSNVRTNTVLSSAKVDGQGRFIILAGKSEVFTINATFYADKKVENDYTFLLKAVNVTPSTESKMRNAIFEGGASEIEGVTGSVNKGKFLFKG